MFRFAFVVKLLRASSLLSCLHQEPVFSLPISEGLWARNQTTTLSSLMQWAFVKLPVFIANDLVGSGDQSSVMCGPHPPGIHSPAEKMDTERHEVYLGWVNGPLDIYFWACQGLFSYFVVRWVGNYQTTEQTAGKLSLLPGPVLNWNCFSTNQLLFTCKYSLLAAYVTQT